MKAVLLSIRPKWCKLIATGRKTLELRKNMPSIPTPFKCFIYQTTKADSVKDITPDFGMVIGEFTCDTILRHCEMANADIAEMQSCVKREKILEYSGGHEVYGWHISDLQIYEKPLPIYAFNKPCIWPEQPYCPVCEFGMELTNFDHCQGSQETEWLCQNFLSFPPQSWCYVEVPEDAA